MMIKPKYYVILLLFLFTAKCLAAKLLISEEDKVKTPSVESLELLLNDAYKHDSNEKLQQFFTSWANVLKPIPDYQRKNTNSAVEELYVFYKAFFNPFDLSSLFDKSDSHTIDSLYLNAKYFIVQNKIVCQVSDLLPTLIPYSYRIFQSNTIGDFRPEIQFDYPGVKILYSSENYITAIKKFLDGNTDREHWILKRRRLQFINRYVTIFPGHWSGYYILTPPIVSKVIFNVNYNKAIIFWDERSCGGVAHWEKINGKWSKISSYMVSTE